MNPVDQEGSHDQHRHAREARVRRTAALLFTSDEAIGQWLATPARALGGRAPQQLLDTDEGAREVEWLILGLAYGNFQ